MLPINNNPLGINRNIIPKDLADYIIDYESTETGWYRKWKSGWIEQGGIYQSIESEDSQIYEFIIPFVNIPSVLITQCRRYFENDALITFNYDELTSNNFSGVTNYVRGNVSNQVSVPFYWYAAGY